MKCKDHGETIVKMFKEGVDSLPCPGCGVDVKVSTQVRRSNSRLDFEAMLFLEKVKTGLLPRGRFSR